MAHHLVLGAGGVGRSTTTHLVARGDTVTLASRSGVVRDRPWETVPGGTEAVDVVAVDAADAEAITRLARGAASIVNAVNPPSYATWDRDWPPVAAAVLTAAEHSGAGLVTVGNLYVYGEVDAPMREDSPMSTTGHKGQIRARMWQDALAAHEAGRVRATELRGSDYFGPLATPRTSWLNELVLQVAKGRVFLPVGRATAPHSWTYQDDVGALAATLATDDRSWGQVWHVPTVAPRTMQEAAADIADLLGRPTPRVRVLPRPIGTALGTVVPFLREMRETRHQFERPYVLDSSHTESTFGLAPTPWDVALKETVAALAR
ncbi:NAD-dependent epimerase [Intrasporangium oryzae NRRL B-24470]|uniref:NAD-dependent epimerase n=1 Tax=Intrasporangium oryzae NRRL B-24470 TaxID=1386089 RepID=W9G4W6_9MICO|nr:NAD-dependent epimerase/dehydratase family protein [Intrasporangium oryzae]EWT01035.1 NAD-dependent epimerase [Intrasporangium oryzae NRRL B-24470]